MSDVEFDQLADNLNRKLNLIPIRAILGDKPPGAGSARLYDSTILGNVWVLQLTSNGYSTPKSVRGPTGSPVIMRAGMPVILKYDADGKLAVKEIDFTGVQAGGNNPAATNASDAQANSFVSTASITTLISTPTAPPSLNVSLRGWKPVLNKVIYDFQGALVDLSSFVPSAGNHCVAVIFIKSDLATIEVFASTAKSTADPLTIAGDLQEAITASTAGSTALWGWRLHDAQTTIVDADRLIDLRNPWDMAGGGGGGFYQTIQSNGTPLTQEVTFDFVDTATVAWTITDDGANTRTKIQAAASGTPSPDLFARMASLMGF